MTAGDDDRTAEHGDATHAHPVDDGDPAAEGERDRTPRHRTVLIAVVSTVVALAVFAVALGFGPREADLTPAATDDERTDIATGIPSATGSAAPDAPRATTASATGAPTTPPGASDAPPASGPRFEDWVDEVAGWLNIPRRAMHAYAAATVTLSDEQPQCNLSWVTLAGVGRTVSDHGRTGDRAITDDGTVSDPIGTIEVRDFEGTVVSRPGAAGPMQLAPRVWREWRASATHETPDIQDLDDAALTAGRALCADGRDLADGDGWLAGVSALHDEPLFLHRTLATANVYGTVGRDGDEPDPAVLDAVLFAIDKIGLPYVWGGNGLERGDQGFDCSGLTTAAYGEAGIDLLRTAHTQYHSITPVPADEQPRLGDLVFYGEPETKIHHVGLYIGNRQMIDAPTFGQAVQVHNYRKPGDNYAGAGRPTA
ncbi:C40 family peptidase [Saccharomonospora halophila]|uniref:C40 family peptidase n=1 Tax=Saccharomonospora halophila TaxID=129922 RepID=UPI000381CA17|nr:C40 family peptidase [Saccharomonospora halophila]